MDRAVGGAGEDLGVWVGGLVVAGGEGGEGRIRIVRRESCRLRSGRDLGEGGGEFWFEEGVWKRRTSVAGELCHEAVGEGHYMFGWWRWREDGFGREAFSSRSGIAAKGSLRNQVL